MNYQRLFSISIRHDYFSNNLCNSLGLLPTSTTDRILKGHGLILKKSFGGLQVLIGIEDDPSSPQVGNPLVPLSSDETFEFDLLVEDKNFGSFTDLSTIDAIEEPALEEGEKSLLVFTADGVPSGGELTTTKIAVNNKRFNSWGRISIDYANFLALEDAPEFFIQFESPAINWTYYLLLDSTETVADYSIEDGNSSPSLVFDNPIDFTADHSLGGSIGERLGASLGSARGVMIQSSSQQKYQEIVRRNIRLLRAGNVLVAHLPNPSFLDDGNSILHLTT